MARVRRAAGVCTIPIASIPLEILLYIFEIGSEALTDPEGYRAKQPIAPRPKSFARTVSRVCRDWRTIVYRNPSLWVTTLVYNENTIGPVPLPQLGWVTHPNSGDLDLIIDPQVTVTLLFGILDALAPYSKRWRVLLVTQNPLGLYHFAKRLNDIGRAFPRLRVFSFRSSPHCPPDPPMDRRSSWPTGRGHRSTIRGRFTVDIDQWWSEEGSEVSLIIHGSSCAPRNGASSLPCSVLSVAGGTAAGRAAAATVEEPTAPSAATVRSENATARA